MDALQGDSGRELIVHLLSGDDYWEIPDDADALIQYRCADGSGGAYDTLSDGSPAYSTDGHTIRISLIGQLFAMAGITRMQVTFVRQSVQLSTFPVEIRVASQVNAEIADSEYVNLAQWLDENKKGDTGDSGVYIGVEEPTNPNVNVWINPNGTGFPVYNGEVL